MHVVAFAVTFHLWLFQILTLRFLFLWQIDISTKYGLSAPLITDNWCRRQPWTKTKKTFRAILALVHHWAKPGHTLAPSRVHIEPPKVCCAMPRLTAVPLYTAKCIYKHKPDGRHVHTHKHTHCGERSVHHQQVLSPVPSGQSVCLFWAVDMCTCTHARTHAGCKWITVGFPLVTGFLKYLGSFRGVIKKGPARELNQFLGKSHHMSGKFTDG